MTTYTATPAAMHSGHDIRDQRGHMVAIVHNPAANSVEGAKIAALMAAAPEMLTALHRCISALAANEAPNCEAAKEAKAAIAQATPAA